MTNYRYTPTLHAIERAKLRYGISAEQAMKWFNDIMAKAKYVTSSQRSDGRISLIYEYNGKRLVVDGDNRKIITITPTEISATPIVDKVKTVVQREYRKIQREYKRKQRSLNLQIAELNIEIAKLALNKVKARSPKIQAIIQTKIDDLKAKVNEIETTITKLADEFERIKRTAEIWTD
ncbi:MAG: hypothetical protein IRZ03_10635 [Acidobacterium ailaaui]|nr:hypothetical protein [Pseudacidobacterium ailaaui]